ncbi:asparagine synthase [Polaribacter sp. SA4-10]|uniref:asparagine synthase C-terminal domain-containing protein n=1 Tax=Polaribacter sp. SA4-10 TaxID=754397 RepID=UPI000B3C2AD9|nr:asparagine synthase C-terminal domain-containing protein [Polaribacter sp. SA4-10]ARV07662.1 asparagine synthase [Polaribacter sp. SA4-10]
MDISLKINKGFKWHSNESIFIKGYFFDRNNNFYQKENALLFLDKITSKEKFIKKIKEINGCFSVLIKVDNAVFIASDTTRSFPLFYTFKNEKIHISDDIVFLKEKYNISEFNKLAKLELKASLHTCGKKTLLQNVFQVQSNEYLIIKNNKIIENNFFFTYAIKDESSISYSSLKKEATLAFENTFKRLLSSLDNKMVVIPLSAGFDSRLIAVFLKKHNYNNVICYTYGSSKSSEIENSKRVAKKLGFKWFFIEYDAELTNDFLNSNDFNEFTHFAGKFSSTPNLQEYFAVKYLKENNLIHKDSIFIPGYSGDLLGGSQFLKVIPRDLKTKEIVPLILKRKFNNYHLTLSEKKILKKEIETNLKNLDKNYHQNIPSSVFENYDITEKIAKYIFNSASFYNFFGFEHRTPFWDKELLLFFKTVPHEFKILKTLFDEVLIEEYFNRFEVNFSNEQQPTNRNLKFQKIKNKIKPFFSTFIKQKKLKKNDWNNYQPITNQLLLLIRKNDLKVKRKSNDYNEIIAQWYVYLCQNKVK